MGVPVTVAVVANVVPVGSSPPPLALAAAVGLAAAVVVLLTGPVPCAAETVGKDVVELMLELWGGVPASVICAVVVRVVNRGAVVAALAAEVGVLATSLVLQQRRPPQLRLRGDSDVLPTHLSLPGSKHTPGAGMASPQSNLMLCSTIAVNRSSTLIVSPALNGSVTVARVTAPAILFNAFLPKPLLIYTLTVASAAGFSPPLFSMSSVTLPLNE